MVAVTPMFPLGAVLMPGAAMPLHVFEPRYRDMIGRCLKDDSEFGVVLISRGHEVGGGEVRSEVGCLARIESSQESPDGRFGIICVGTERIRVTEWLADDPHPRALTDQWPGPAASDDAHVGTKINELAAMLRRTLAVGAEAGLALAPATVALSDDPVVVGYQAATLAPIGPFDMYEILRAEGPDERLALAHVAVQDACELLELRLGARSGGDDGDTASD